MNKEDLDDRIREYFAAQLLEHAAPDFESMLAHAASQGRRRILPWLVPTLAASLLVAIALRHGDQDGGDPRATAALIAELSTSTHWTAPSDRWLARQMAMPLRALPDFDRMTTTLPEDRKVWL